MRQKDKPKQPWKQKICKSQIHLHPVSGPPWKLDFLVFVFCLHPNSHLPHVAWPSNLFGSYLLYASKHQSKLEPASDAAWSRIILQHKGAVFLNRKSCLFDNLSLDLYITLREICVLHLHPKFHGVKGFSYSTWKNWHNTNDVSCRGIILTIFRLRREEISHAGRTRMSIIKDWCKIGLPCKCTMDGSL